ncbi:unnamed protein product [Alopecurus aequalis]
MPITTTSPVDGCATWVLPNYRASITTATDLQWEKTTAGGWTKNKLPIVASFRRQPPPLPSNLFVHSPGDNAHFSENPHILCIVDYLILLHVAIGCTPAFISMLECEYYVYRANPRNPSIELVPNPSPHFFLDHEVRLLPRGDQHYIIAALVRVPGSTHDEFNLLLFDSRTGSWSTKKLSVESPLEFEVEIPRNGARLLRHRTSTVITIGGEDDTMGWVDLWRGILLCDVLRDKPTLRNVPLPFPKNHLAGNNGIGRESSSRPRMVHNWRITTYSNDKMSASWKDWKKDCTVQASDIVISDQVISEFRLLGLLQHQPGRDGDAAAAVQGLHNLAVSDPVPSITDDGVVYLMARVKFCHPKACVLAIDTRKNTVQSVAKFGTENESNEAAMYSPCTLSECMNPATTPANMI